MTRRRAWAVAVVAAVGGVAAAAIAARRGVSAAERAGALPGDELVPDARVVLDRATTLPVPPERVWPWIVQLGKQRGGWYLPRWLETVIPPARRGLQQLEPRFQTLTLGDEVPDWGPGQNPVFQVAEIDSPHLLVYTSERVRPGREPLRLSWTHSLTAVDGGTRLHLRLRISRIGQKAPRLMAAFAEAIDAVTIAPMFAGLKQRLR
jgi:uncharacterized protein YndB with AHSA1/START domain